MQFSEHVEKEEKEKEEKKKEENKNEPAEGKDVNMYVYQFKSTLVRKRPKQIAFLLWFGF